VTAPSCEAASSCGKSVCCPTSELKTVKKRYYSDLPEEFCLPYSLLGLALHKCDCSKVRHRKDLIVKVRPQCECCVKRCYPTCQPPCAGACPSGCATGCAAATVETPTLVAPSAPSAVRQTTVSPMPSGSAVITIKTVPER
jgi:hypothetical protein